MIHKTLVILTALAALATLTIGIVSFWHGVPANTLFIDNQQSHTTVHLAMIDGTLHAVYEVPLGQSQAMAAEYAYGPFYARQVVVGSTLAAGIGGPFWVPALLLALWPLAAFARGPLRRRRRRKRGECIHCGYNLTGVPEPRCPECGHPAPSLPPPPQPDSPATP